MSVCLCESVSEYVCKCVNEETCESECDYREYVNVCEHVGVGD